MQCWRCGADAQPGDRTCANCGARLTSPPTGDRSQRPSSQRYPPQRAPSRRPRDSRDGRGDADWRQDAPNESDYAAEYSSDYGQDGQPPYSAPYPPDDRHQGRQASRSGGDDGWDDDPRARRGRTPQGRSRTSQRQDGYDAYDEYAQSGYNQPNGYDDDYAGDSGDDYGAAGPDPLNDPRAPNNLRSNSRRGSDGRGGRAPGDASARYARGASREGSRDGSRDDWQQGAADGGDGRYRRPSGDPARDRRRDGRDGRDDGGYRGRGGASEDMLPPLTQERRGVASSADNRYGRSSGGRGQSSPYDDGYENNGGYGADAYGERPRGPRQGQSYGRRMPPDERGASYQPQPGNPQGRSWQQRWSDTVSGFRIPGARAQQQEEPGNAKASSRRMVTTIVLLVALAVVVVAGGVIFAPHIIARLHPSAANSPLCAPVGPNTADALPTPPAHFKQFTSARSRYGVSYPETWTVEPQQKAATGYDYIDVYTLPNSPTSATIEQPEAACALSDLNIIQGEVAAAQQQNISFAEDTAAAASQTIGGEQWQRREYDVTDKGVTLHMVILACHHQGRAYVIVLVSKTTTFKQDDTGIFEPMLKSFAFTK